MSDTDLEKASAHLCDFSSSVKFKSSCDMSEFALCTGEMQAPEIVQKRPFGLAADIWGLGCLLYQILTACLPTSNPVTPSNLSMSVDLEELLAAL